MREGDGVVYEGSPAGDLQTGTPGRLLALASHEQAHMMVLAGPLADQVLVVDTDDLRVARRTHNDVDDSLEYGTLSTVAAREIYDSLGEVGVLDAMAASGHLDTFSSIAEEAHTLMASRIRNDPSFREVTAQLEDDEAEALVSMACLVLVRDAFGQ